MTNNLARHYVNGAWVQPTSQQRLAVENPATEATCGKIVLANLQDSENAIAAAKQAFPMWAESSRSERIELLEQIQRCYEDRINDIAEAMTLEMGAPQQWSRGAQAGCGTAHIDITLETLRNYAFEESHGSATVRREAIGVCGLITPWNWPMNQITLKVIPALAAGCSMVLKPSEIAPISAQVFSEVMHDAGVPAGVYNMIQGDGAGAGQLLSSHPDIDMVSFTGSTRAGILVAENAAPTIKRVAQELGGKSPNVILEDADLEKTVYRGAKHALNNAGQSCNAPTRMLVVRHQYEECIAIAQKAVESYVVGDPNDPTTTMGPVVSQQQYEKVQGFIAAGIDEGARLVTGGLGRPNGLQRGWFVKPTLFADVNNQMTIAQQEIFGPVLSMIPYDTLDEAIEIANDTPYGLAAYVSSADEASALAVARRIRAGMVHLNNQSLDDRAPFGGYKHSGNGREAGVLGLEEFLEAKAISNFV